jgi:hypothetical protein
MVYGTGKMLLDCLLASSAFAASISESNSRLSNSKLIPTMIASKSFLLYLKNLTMVPHMEQLKMGSTAGLLHPVGGSRL